MRGSAVYLVADVLAVVERIARDRGKDTNRGGQPAARGYGWNDGRMTEPIPALAIAAVALLAFAGGNLIGPWRADR